MLFNLKHEILAKSKTITDSLFRRVMNILFGVTLAVLGLLRSKSIGVLI